MDFTPWLGYLAGTLTVVSYVPQAIRVWRTKEVDDLSWMMVAMLVTAGALWITYGVVSSQPPVILTNIGTTILTAAILVAKFRFGRGKRAGKQSGEHAAEHDDARGTNRAPASS